MGSILISFLVVTSLTGQIYIYQRERIKLWFGSFLSKAIGDNHYCYATYRVCPSGMVSFPFTKEFLLQTTALKRPTGTETLNSTLFSKLFLIRLYPIYNPIWPISINPTSRRRGCGDKFPFLYKDMEGLFNFQYGINY
ncbi:hypothetical protein BDV25DRAFT_113978 [Aspergillus avenaceus]|uniref:Uncharacterized protein n=1 Tax=Aspergillus avenaceus TaxID=36643 RepID=A0A5N6TCW0_ASPAV|nr:hypothetical protein BDV25DRAFT_113978 [Aspergillus avenaceus]